ncbi:MAG: biotin--[acetyl-CoA-carboxylase] ligase [Deltaproteobacteria bacterium]|nr:biotin--[acetyl-CoA-carboxylase] ligase [Deltaproteobacteria bacterium]
MNFTEKALKEKFGGKKIGGLVRYFREVDSTNIMACRLARDGAPEGTVVIADAQGKGKGRLNRVWQSPPGRNLYVSIILRPRIAPPAAPQLTLVAGVAVAELLASCGLKDVTIKWPNDVLISGKKVCGILTEMNSSASGVDFIILGIGLNVNMNRENFEPALRDRATSLKIETGKTHDRIEIISGLLNLIETWYSVFLRTGFPGVRDAWLNYADILGRPIRVVFREDTQTGVVMGIDDDGTILMKSADGATQRVIAGDVYLLKE